jgi:alcohol dehydrogenase
MLPHVVRFNAAGGEGNPYADLVPDAGQLADRLDQLLVAGGLPRRLGDVDVKAEQLPEMARVAAQQWTATFNPRKVGEGELLSVYRAAL